MIKRGERERMQKKREKRGNVKEGRELRVEE